MIGSKEIDMLKPRLTAAIAAVLLAGCDAATEIAGDTFEGEARNAISAQCQQISESAGIAAGRIAEVCECSADTFLADPDLTLADVSRERIEGIVNDCAATTGSAPETTPAEEIGG